MVLRFVLLALFCFHFASLCFGIGFGAAIADEFQLKDNACVRVCFGHKYLMSISHAKKNRQR